MKQLVAALALVSLGAAPLAAQDVRPAPRAFVEVLGGGVVPTFDIADVAKTGGAIGGAAGYHLTDRWVVMGEFSYGMHKDQATGTADINTLHYMGKVGYSLTGPRTSGWEALVNLGLGAVTFDVEGAPDALTYFAINAGAKLAYHVNRSFSLVLSPQGNIAFSKESELTTTNAWVWPFTVGLRARF